MYQEAPRWLLIVVLIACLVGLVAWARGPEHHHGQYVGVWMRMLREYRERRAPSRRAVGVAS